MKSCQIRIFITVHVSTNLQDLRKIDTLEVYFNFLTLTIINMEVLEYLNSLEKKLVLLYILFFNTLNEVTVT